LIGAIARKGNVVCEVLEDTDKVTMHKFVLRTVSERVSLLSTDDHPNYKALRVYGNRHRTVTHRDGE